MDLSTLLGIVTVFILIFTAIFSKGQIDGFFDISSILIVIGGSVGAIIISYPFDRLKNIIKVVKKAFREGNHDLGSTIEKFAEISYTAKKEGLLALEKYNAELSDDFIKKGILLLVDGTNPDMIKKILTLEVENMQIRHEEGENIFRNLGKYAPAFGMIGTLIGLIIMLKNLDDVATLGPAMGVALVTTFYGALLANGVFLPLADKLKYKSEKETVFRMMVIEGILSILEGESPYMIREKLKTFIEQKERDKKEDKGEKSQKTTE